MGLVLDFSIERWKWAFVLSNTIHMFIKNKTWVLNTNLWHNCVACGFCGCGWGFPLLPQSIFSRQGPTRVFGAGWSAAQGAGSGVTLGASQGTGASCGPGREAPPGETEVPWTHSPGHVVPSRVSMMSRLESPQQWVWETGGLRVPAIIPNPSTRGPKPQNWELCMEQEMLAILVLVITADVY